MSYPGPWVQPPNMRVGKFVTVVGGSETIWRKYGGLVDADGSLHFDSNDYAHFTDDSTIGEWWGADGLASTGSPIDFDKADQARQSAEVYTLLYPDQNLGSSSVNGVGGGASSIVKYGGIGSSWSANFTEYALLASVPATVDYGDATQGLPAGDDPVWDDPRVIGYEFHPDDLAIGTVDHDQADVYGSWVTWGESIVQHDAIVTGVGSPFGFTADDSPKSCSISLPSAAIIAQAADPAFRGMRQRFAALSLDTPGEIVEGDRTPPSLVDSSFADWRWDALGPITLTQTQRESRLTPMGSGAPPGLPIVVRTKALSQWQGAEGAHIAPMDSLRFCIDFLYRPFRYRLLYDTPQTIPYQRMFPREDAFGTGPSRIIPRPRSSQGSPRIIGGYR